MQNSVNSNHSQNGNNLMYEIAFSDQLIKFSVTDHASVPLVNSVSSIDNPNHSANPVIELPNEQVKVEKSQNLLINMQFELSEPYLITNIHLVSTYMEFSKANFEFYQAKQNQFSHQRINGIEKNAQNHQFINMIKLEPSQCVFLEKLGLVSDEQSQNKEYQLKVLGIAQALKLQFQITSHTVMDVLVKFQNDHQNYSDSVYDNIKQFLGSDQDDLTHNKLLDIDDALSLFKVCFESIQIFGYKLSCSPPASHGVGLLNLSNIFRKHNRIEEAVETEILSGLSFMNSRKFVQSSEIFTKAAKYFRSKYLKSISKDMNQVLLKKSKQNNYLVESIQNSQVGKLQLEKSGDLMNYILQRNSLKQHFQLFQSAQSIQPSHQIRTSYSVQGNNYLIQENQLKQNLLDNVSYNSLIQQTSNKNLIKSAKMELLVADCIVQPCMLNQKVAAYSRAIDSFTNVVEEQQVNINNNFDPYSALLKLSPYLTKLSLKCLSDKQENVQVAAIKTLEFMVEQLGCTLGNQLPCILISVFMNYPILKEEEEQTILKQYDISDSEDNEELCALSQNSSRSGFKTDKEDSDKKRNSTNIENIENEEDLEKEIFNDEDADKANKNELNTKKANKCENEGKRIIILEEERCDELDFEKEKQVNQQIKQQIIVFKFLNQLIKYLIKKKAQKEADKDKKLTKKGSNSLQTLAQIRKKMEKRQKGNFVSKASFQHIVDSYHHFLETFINVLASASSQILRIIFQEIISVYILLRELSPDLRIYVFRIAEKILAICQGDVQKCLYFFLIQKIDMSFFHYMLYAIDGSGYESFYTEAQITNIQYYALKLWETIKLKLVYNMNISQLNVVINWISEMLLALLEAEQEGEKKDLQNILNKVYQLLDLITIITIRYHTNRKNLNPTDFLKNDSYYARQEELNLEKQMNDESQSALANLVDNGEDESQTNQSDINKKSEKVSQVDVEEETNIILKYFKKIKLSNNNDNAIKSNQKFILINQKAQICVDNLIKPLILWVENSLQYQNQIDIFKNIWLVMVEIMPEESSINLYDVAYPLLERVAEHIQMSSPPHLMLEFIKIIISSLPKLKLNAQNENVYFLQQFFVIFCDCIPHSVNEEPFQIFDILLYIIQLHLNPEIVKKCIDTLVDKFTMRGKAQKRSQEFFLRVLASKPNINSFKYFIDECLVSNEEPQFVKFNKNKQTKQAKKANKDQDLKQFNNEYEIFQEKIILLQEGLIYLQYYHFENLKQLFEDNVLSQAVISKLKLLLNLIKQMCLFKIIEIINSGNSKVRAKATNIAKLFLEQYLKGFSSEIAKKNKQEQGNQSKWIFQYLNNLCQYVLGKKNKLDTSKKGSTLNTQEKEIEDPDFYQNIFKTDLAETKQIDYIQVLMIKFQLQITKVTFCQENRDNKLLFNSLIILDLLFQTIFSGPSVQNEIEKYIKDKQPEILNTFIVESNANKNQFNDSKLESQNFQLSPNSNDLDLNSLLIQPNTQFIRTSSEFQELRLNEIIDLIPLVSNLLHSPWSNIRSLTYGLLCYWVKPNIGNYKTSQQKQFMNLILDIIENLLENQESECRTGGLNIVGSLCGLGYNFDAYTDKMKDILGLFRQCENLIPAKVWKAIYKIQFDWDSTNQAAALALIQLCAPKKKIKKFYLQMNKTSSIVLNLDQKNNSRLSVFSQLNQGKEDSFINFSNIFNRQNDKKNIKRAQSVQVQSLQKESNEKGFQDNLQNKQISELVINRNNDNLLISNQDEVIQKYQEENAKMGSQNEYKNSVKSANIINNNINDDEEEESQKEYNDDEIEGIFWVEQLNSKDIRDYISMFRNEYKPPSTLWIERVNYNNEEDSGQLFQDQQEAIQLSEETDILTVQQRSNAQQKQQSQQINFRQQNNTNHQLGQYIDQEVQFQQSSGIKVFNEQNEQDQGAKASKIHRGNINHDIIDDQLDLEQLGIIDAGEEDWNESEENRIVNEHNLDLQYQAKKDKDQFSDSSNVKQNKQITDEASQQKLYINERKKFQSNKNQIKDNSVDSNDYLGSPRDMIKNKLQDSTKNQQTFPTDDDELDEEALEAELKDKIEQNFNINSETNELELIDDQSYQYQPLKHQKLFISPQSSQNLKTPANQKRQTYNLPTSNSEEEVINNQTNVNHESKTYLQKLMQTNSDKKNKMQKNLDLLSQTSSQQDDVIRLNENCSTSSKEESESSKNQVQQTAPSSELEKDDKVKIIDGKDLKEQLKILPKQNEIIEKNEKANAQSQKQDFHKNEKVFNINSFLMNDKEYQQQKIYQDQKQLLLKQSKMSNLLANQQQQQQAIDNTNNQLIHTNIQQQIIQQQQLLADAQSKKKQPILIEGDGNTNNKLMQLSDSNSIQDLCFDINHDSSSSQEKPENANDKLFYISKTQESSDLNEIEEIKKNNFEILDSSETQQSYDSEKSNQLYSKTQQNQEQNINWENISLKLQQQQQNKGAKIEQALAFSFQNSNQTSMPQSNHASVLLIQNKKGEEISSAAQQTEQTSLKVFNSFQMAQNEKSRDEDTSPNKLYDGSQFQSAEFERSPDTDRENILNINLYQNDKNNTFGSSPPIARKIIQDEKSKEILVQNSQNYQNFDFEKQNYEKYLGKGNQKNDLETSQKKNELREFSQENLMQQLANYQKFDKKTTLQYTSSSEDQVVILDSNQTLDRPTSKENKSKILIDTSGNYSKNSGGALSSEDRKYQKNLSNIDEVLEESKFVQQNTNGLVTTIKKKAQKKDQEGEQYFIREGESSRYNRKDEGIIEEFLTEEESSTEEQSQIKLKQRYASEPVALQPIFPLSSAQSPSQSQLQKSEEYFGRFQGQINTPLLSGQSHLISQQSTQQQNLSTANATGNTTANEINHINSASSKNTKRSVNKSKERSNSPKQKKTQKKMQTQLQQTNNQIQQQQLQIYQQQNQQLSQLQSISSYQQSQLHSPQQQQQTQYYNSENLTAFQTPLIQKSLTPSNRAKEIAFRRNSNSSQKGLSGQSNGEIFTSKKRLNMNENIHTHHLHNNQYMNNSSNSKHNKTSESGGNGTHGKYYKSIGYKLLTKNHSTNNIFNTSSLINTTQGSTSFNNGSAINLALSQLHNNTSNNQQKSNNVCKDKLIKKLMTSKGLDASELKSVIKLHQQTQMFFNHPQNTQYIPIGSSSGDTKNRVMLSKSPQQKNIRQLSHDSEEKSKKKSKSTSPLNERIDMSSDENKDSYPNSLHLSSNCQNSLKNSKLGVQFSKDQIYNSGKSQHINEHLQSQKQLKKGGEQQLKNQQVISQQQYLQSSITSNQFDDESIQQRYKRNFSNLQINEEKNENSDNTSKATVNDDLSHHFSTLSQQGRSNSYGKIHNNSGKKKRKSKSKEQLTINENGYDISNSKKEKMGSNEKELTVSLASSTKSSNVQIKNKKFQPINISGLTSQQIKTQPQSSSKQQQFERFLNQGASSGNKQNIQNKRSSSSKKQKELSKSKSKKEVVILQNISQQIQQFNQQVNNNTSNGYINQDQQGNKQKLKNEILNFAPANQNKNKKYEQTISSQLKMLQQSTNTQPQLSNDSYLVFDTQQQFFKAQSNSQNPNSNYNEFMKNAQQIKNNKNQQKNINKEIMDELNQTL
ncbi:hypothetical protein ABPG74_001731 [Tetrahymena malaccensis]